jgi:peroxiredoxin
MSDLEVKQASKAQVVGGGESGTKTIYSAVWVMKIDKAIRKLDAAARRSVREKLSRMFSQVSNTDVSLRAAYSLNGYRSDADLILWLLADNVDALQSKADELAWSGIGEYMHFADVLLGATSYSQYVPEHIPAFVRNIEPRMYVAAYPFIKTAEWYLLDFEERRRLMIQHGDLGEGFDILTNTVDAFGLGDYEFVVVLEANNPYEIVKCIKKLREAEVRRYTKLETPIYFGRKIDLNRLPALDS